MRCYRKTTHLIQRPCYQRGSSCKDPAGNWTTPRPPDDHKEMQTAVVWTCLLFIRSAKNHLARHSTAKGGRRQGRQRKRWENNIREWTGLKFSRSQRAAENREKWRKLVAKSSVVPQWPSRLKDRWWWWWITQHCACCHQSVTCLSLHNLLPLMLCSSQQMGPSSPLYEHCTKGSKVCENTAPHISKCLIWTDAQMETAMLKVSQSRMVPWSHWLAPKSRCRCTNQCR